MQSEDRAGTVSTGINADNVVGFDDIGVKVGNVLELGPQVVAQDG